MVYRDLISLKCDMLYTLLPTDHTGWRG